MNDTDLLQTAIRAAISGGMEIMRIYQQDFSVEYKADDSPLTMADKKSHEAISGILSAAGLNVLSEEGSKTPYHIRKKWKRFWMVDPLDGTKEFVKRNGEFTVNIALIDSTIPVLGVIFVPVTGVLYFASRISGAFRFTITENKVPEPAILKSKSLSLPLTKARKKYTVVASKSHFSSETTVYIEELKKARGDVDFISVGSSLKLCLIAEGQADLYPRFGPTMEWDIAAGHALVEMSGGFVKRADHGKPITYNKENLLNPWFIAGRE